MKILYIGTANPDGTCLARMRGLESLGHDVHLVDTDPHIARRIKPLRVLHHRLLVGPGIRSLNREVVARVREVRPDVVWVDKGVFVRRETLERARRAWPVVIVHHNTDDILNRRHGFRHYLAALDAYDAHFTSNVHNLEEMRRLTSRYVGFNELGYDGLRFGAHERLGDVGPGNGSGSGSGEVGDPVFFVGHWEPPTEELIAALVEAGVPVRARGPGWSAARGRRRLADHVEDTHVGGEAYVRVLTRGQIGLGIVSTWNRNHTAARVFEIPACGTMLLAVRNEVLSALYEEGREAEFFSTPEELVEKARYYLEHPEERDRIAAAGRERCLRNRCSWRDRVEQVLEELGREKLLPAGRNVVAEVSGGREDA